MGACRNAMCFLHNTLMCCVWASQRRCHGYVSKSIGILRRWLSCKRDKEVAFEGSMDGQVNVMPLGDEQSAWHWLVWLGRGGGGGGGYRRSSAHYSITVKKIEPNVKQSLLESWLLGTSVAWLWCAR